MLNWPFMDAGPRDGLPVVCLHAFPYHSGMWSAQRAVLSERHRFLAFDARGLGLRRAETTAYLLEHTVDDLLALLDHLKLARAVLCGVSMGGYAALRAAQRAPERVLGLVLANTQAAADGDAAKLARAEGLRVLHREGVRAFANAQIDRQLAATSQAKLPALKQSLLDMAEHATLDGIAASLVAIATRTDQLAALEQITAPTLILAGADDVVTPPELAQTLAERIPGAELRTIAHAGHLTNLENETAFNSALLEFLGKFR